MAAACSRRRPTSSTDVRARRETGWSRCRLEWLGRLEAALREGQASGELTRCDVVELARELHGHLLAANWARQLLGERDAFSRARRLVTRRLRELTPTRGKKV
jgi:hypothetical protein